MQTAADAGTEAPKAPRPLRSSARDAEGFWVSFCIAGLAHAWQARELPANPAAVCCLLSAVRLIPLPAKGMDGHPMYPCAKLKLDQLFLQWLSLPESQTLVRGAGVTRCGLALCL